MTTRYTLSNIDDTARKVLTYARSKILLFYGEMGVGKTTLIKAIVKQLGILETTGSPTFALVHEYGDTQKVYHFDLYRIKTEEEVYDIGFEEYLISQAWICIEWPEKIVQLLPDHYTTIRLTTEKNNEKILFLKNSV